MQLPNWLVSFRTFLGAITDILISGRNAGLWNAKNIPIIPVKPLVGANSLFNPLTTMKGAVKTFVVKKGLQEAQSKIDTPEERQEITKVVVAGLHLPGLPKNYAWLLSAASGLFNMFLEVISSSDSTQLLSNWKLYAHTVLVALVAKIFLWIRQNSTNGIAVLEASTVAKINEVLPVDEK